MERATSFSSRSEDFIQKFLSCAGTTSLSNLPYMHYLQNHVGDLMQLHGELFGWVYIWNIFV